MQHKLLSIIIPTYNREQYIVSTLDMFVCQIEKFNLIDKVSIIVSDNFSTDRTKEKLLKYEHCPFVHTFTQEKNIGAINSIMKALTYVNSDYIWIFGDDDLIQPNLLDLLVSKLSYEDVDLITLTYTNVHVYKNSAPENITLLEQKKLIVTQANASKIDLNLGFIGSNVIKYTTFLKSLNEVLSSGKINVENQFLLKAVNYHMVFTSDLCFYIEQENVLFKYHNPIGYTSNNIQTMFKTFVSDQYGVLSLLGHYKMPFRKYLIKKYKKEAFYTAMAIRMETNDVTMINKIQAIYPGVHAITLIKYMPTQFLKTVYNLYKKLKTSK